MTKLGIHCIGGGNSAKALIDAGIPVAKFTDGFGLLPYAKSKNVPYRIGRRIVNFPDDPSRVMTAENQRFKDPQVAARDYMNVLRPYILANPDANYWEGFNEPIWNTVLDMQWYAEFEAERIRLLAQMGLKAVFGNFSTGSPGDLSLWQGFKSVIPVARQYGAIFGLHEYGGTWMWWMTGGYQIAAGENTGNEGWTTLRFVKVYRELGILNNPIPLIITECGLDAVHPPRPGFNSGHWKFCAGEWMRWDGRDDPISYWRDGGRDPERYYAEQLIWYDKKLQEFQFVIGATIFTLGGVGSWADYDIEGTRVASHLIDYVLRQFPTPEPPPDGGGDDTPTMPINLLKNGSFELGTYKHNNVNEFNIPNDWKFWYQNDTSLRLDHQYDKFYPPEVIAWYGPTASPEDRAEFFKSGDFVIKAFGGWKPLWMYFEQAVNLVIGKKYKFSVNVNPDLVADYVPSAEHPKKTFAPDPISGEHRLVVIDPATGVVVADTGYLDGTKVKFGKYNLLSLEFVASKANLVVRIELRGRHGLDNNGWFIDDAQVVEVGVTLPPPPADTVDLSAEIEKLKIISANTVNITEQINELGDAAEFLKSSVEELLASLKQKAGQ